MKTMSTQTSQEYAAFLPSSAYQIEKYATSSLSYLTQAGLLSQLGFYEAGHSLALIHPHSSFWTIQPVHYPPTIKQWTKKILLVGTICERTLRRDGQEQMAHAFSPITLLSVGGSLARGFLKNKAVLAISCPRHLRHSGDV